MHRLPAMTFAIVVSAAAFVAQAPAAIRPAAPKPTESRGTPTGPGARSQLVEMEMMTHEEVFTAIHEQGRTTVLVYNGGTEQRGPHCVLGGHTLMARKIVEAIARRLGNALAAPVLPFSPTGVDPRLPGSVAVPPEVFAGVNVAVVDSMVKNGFKNVVLMGDHGGGQQQLKQVAEAADAKYGPQGTHVYYCDDVYSKAHGDFDAWLKQNGYPASSHGGIPDTSVMMYLGSDAWVRKDKITFGDRVLPRSQTRDPSAPRINNGITGDARPSSPALGKRLFDMKVDYAVAQITRFVGGTKASGEHH